MALGLIRFLVLLFTLYLLISILRRMGIRLNSPRRHKVPIDPYRVLGVSANATEDEIKDAYREELAKYHPDKVAHLGEELQKLAQSKTAEIIAAYKQIGPKK